MIAPKLLWAAVAALIASASADAAQSFPKHWGEPPPIQTRDYRPLPGGYGFGNSTLARWIQENLDRDAGGGAKPAGLAVGKGATAVGEMQEGRKFTLMLEAPSGSGPAHDYEVTVRFIHKSGAPEHVVTAARAKPKSPTDAGEFWQAQFTPEKSGQWIYRVSFADRKSGAPGDAAKPVPAAHRRSGTFSIAPATAKAK